MIQVKDLIEGQYYQSLNSTGIFIFKCSKSGSPWFEGRLCMNGTGLDSYGKKSDFGRGGLIEGNITPATEENKKRLEICLMAGKYVPYNETMLNSYTIF